jgi:transcription termination factor Rho
MAFKATRKAPAKKSHDEPTTTSVDDVVAPAAVHTPEAPKEADYRVEDFVGAPVSEPVEQASQQPAVSAPLPVSDQNQQPQMPMQQSYGSQGGMRDRGPRREFGRGGGRNGGGHRYGGGGGGYRNEGGYNRDNGYRRGGGGYNDRPHREYTDVSPRPAPYSDVGMGGAFTPDINVPTETVRGVLDTMPEGHGFLRPKYTPSDRDVYISQSQIRRFLLRNGDMVEGQARPPKESERYWGLLKVEKVNELPADQMEKRPRFEDLVPVYPNKQLKLETTATPLSTRMIDLLAPIGFGQRGLVVSPPKAGKTTILKEIAAGISANYPEVHLMAVLIGERPEEVTDISRSVKGEVYASNFDESPDHQTRVAEVALDRAKRLIEMGHDVVILLDSITRLARAYNLVVNPSGRTLSGGFDPAALYPAKKFLGAARCNEPFVTPEEQAKLAAGETPVVKRVTDGGSLTIIGTALVETGSRMDDLIYEEFKGTGNMELHLSRSLQERRIFPAIDIARSGTRHDELLLGEDLMKKVTTLRHMLSLLSDEECTMMLIERLNKAKSNSEFLEALSQG